MLTGGVQIPEYPGDHFHYVFSKILMAGRANGLQVIDGPFLKIRELGALRLLDALPDPRLRRQVGAPSRSGDGHQRGVHADAEQFDRAFDILEAYEKATTEGDRKGAVMFGADMIDEASRKMANKFVVRGERAGMRRS